MAEVQGIQFEIIGSSKSAVDSLDRLSTALQKIRTASRGGIGLSKIVAEIRALNTAINLVNFDKVANGILKIGVAVKELKLSKLGNLADAFSTIEKIGGANFNMSSLGQAQQYLTGISKLDFSNLEDAAKAINALSNGSKSGLSDTAQALSDIERYRNGDASVISRYSLNDTNYQWARDMTSLLEPEETGSIREALDPGDVERASSAFKRFGEIVSSVFGSLRSSASGAAKATKEVANAAEKAGGSLELARVGRNLAGALGDIAKGAGKAALSLGKLGGKAIAAPFISAGKAIGGVASKIKTIFSSIGRIAFYRLIRTGIKLVTEAFTEGIKAAYQWSKVVGGPVSASGMSFAESMDDIATSLKYFKNGIGAAAAPLIGALAPAIRVATDAAVEFLNVINQLMALLTGQSGWMRATRQAEEYEEAVGGAGGAAKEALRYLAPFDELNVLPSQKQGGGGGGADDYGGMFEEMVEFEQGIIDFADRIKKAIEDSDWQGLGTLLGDKINEIIDRIDFAELGTKIGKKINALFTTKYWTLDSINFQEIGGYIATFLNNAIDNIDFEIIGRSLSQKFTNIFDIAIGFINELDFGDLGKALSDYVLGAIRELSEWIQSVDWSEFVHNLITGVFDFIANIQLGEILSSIGDLAGSIGGALIEIAMAILQDVFTSVTDPDWWKLVWAWFQENIVEGFANLGVNIANGIIQSLQDGLNSFADVWNESDLNQWIKDTLGWDWTIPPIEWELIPKVDIDAGYDELKAQFEQKSKDAPVALQAAIDSINESIPEVDREISVSGVLDSLIDQLEDSQKEVFVTAEVGSVSAKRMPELPVAAEVSEIVESENIYELRGVVGIVESAEPSTELTMHPPGIYTRALYKWSDPSPLTRDMRTINTWANFAWVKKENLTKEQRTIGTYSNFRWVRTAELTKDQKTINTYSNFKWVKTADLTKDQKTINTYSNFKWVKTGALSLAQKTIDVIGNYTSTAFSSLTAANRTIDATANFKGSKIDPSIQDYWGRIRIGATANIEGVTGQTTITMIPQANGGVFTNGFWRSIPQYASGGRAHGSMFVAGEAGPEVVGHIGGRTEVLNRSQLAATMYAAVRSAMSGIVIRPVTPESYMDESTNEEAVYRAFVRAINDTGLNDEKELDGDVLYRAMVNRNRRNTRMTGVNAMA